MVMMEEVLRGICNVVWVYPDGSKKVIFTTLNQDILAQVGVVYRPEHFYDFKRKKYIKFDRSVRFVMLLDELDELEEVDAFANLFT